MSKELTCGFCGKEIEPRRVEKGGVVIFYCTNCESVVAAYLKEYEELLKFGKLFDHPLDQYKPRPPSFIRERGGIID